MTDNLSEKRNKKAQRDRYWSLMLVGDHGRIIPFRRFKGIAAAFIVILIVALLALTVLSFLYWRQSLMLDQATDQLSQLRRQTDQLRNEKDVLLARLVMENKLPPEENNTPANAVASLPETAQSADSVKKSTPEKAVEKETQAVSPPGPPKVKLGAEIRQFEVTYDHKRSILQSRFRIYNDNKPKERLSGRIVVIFKKEQDPPMKWIPVPTVQISNSRPDGKKGKPFEIRNYRTMTFKAYGLKAPIEYDTAGVYVFSDDGNLILSQEFGFEIEAPPVPVEKPQPAPTQSIQPSKTSPPEESSKDSSEEGEPEGDDAGAADKTTPDRDEENASEAQPVSPPSDAAAYPAYPDPYSRQQDEDEPEVPADTQGIPGKEQPDEPDTSPQLSDPGLEKEIQN